MLLLEFCICQLCLCLAGMRIRANPNPPYLCTMAWVIMPETAKVLQDIRTVQVRIPPAQNIIHCYHNITKWRSGKGTSDRIDLVCPHAVIAPFVLPAIHTKASTSPPPSPSSAPFSRKRYASRSASIALGISFMRKESVLAHCPVLSL